MQLLNEYSSFINGEFVPMSSDKVLEDRNPSDGSLLAKIHCADDETLDLAVNAAENAFGTWGTTSREYRAYILNEMADAIEENLDHLASVEAMDMLKWDQ